MAILPQALRSLTPARVRDDVRLRALALGLGHDPAAHDALRAGRARAARRRPRRATRRRDRRLRGRLGGGAVRGARARRRAAPDRSRSARTRTRCRVAGARASGRRDAPSPARGAGAGARLRACAGTWLSHEVADRWHGEVDLVFIDGDHSEAGCELDWSCWQRFVAVGGRVAFHDARADQPSGRGLPGPTAVVARHFRGGAERRAGRSSPRPIARSSSRALAERRAPDSERCA